VSLFEKTIECGGRKQKKAQEVKYWTRGGKKPTRGKGLP